MLAPIVQRRPFPAALVGALGILLYGFLLLNLKGPGEARAAAPQEGASQGHAIIVKSDAGGVPRIERIPSQEGPFEGRADLGQEALEKPPLVLRPVVQEEREKTKEAPRRNLPLGTLRGRLVDEVGAALGGWQVQVTHHRKVQTATTSESGRFEFEDVEQGEHVLLAWNIDDLRSLRTTPLATTGSPTEVSVLVCDVPLLRAEIEGVIRTKSGRRLRGVTITPVLPIPQGVEGALLLRGAPTVSLDEGRFLLRNIPRSKPSARSPEREGARLLLWITEGGVLPSLLEWSGGDLVVDEGAELVIELGLDSEMRNEATHLIVRDENDAALRIVREGASAMSATWEVPLKDLWGSELWCEVPADAVEVALVRRTQDGPWVRVATRTELNPSPDFVTRLRFR